MRSRGSVNVKEQKNKSYMKTTRTQQTNKCIFTWRNEDIKLDTLLFSPNYREIIQMKETIKDLRVLVDQKLK